MNSRQPLFLKKGAGIFWSAITGAPGGEIDLICRDREVLVFVEVKYRSDDCFGVPMEAVDSRKQVRIRKTAAAYLGKKKLPFDTPCRFDVVGIGNKGIELLENAF